jgi:integrase
VAFGRTHIPVFQQQSYPSIMTKKMKPWNSGDSVGPREKFTPSQICVLENQLKYREELHDRCLFTVAIDSMLRCNDVLNLRVRHVTDQYGVVLERFWARQEKVERGVAPAITKTTREALRKWIEFSGKRPNDFLFTRTKTDTTKPIHENTYRLLVKSWARMLKLSPETYSTHSLRRSKPHFMFYRGVSIAHISTLLGHKDTKTTLLYIGVTHEEAQAEALKHDIFKKSFHTYSKQRTAHSLNSKIDVFEAGFVDLNSQIQQLKTSLEALSNDVREIRAENNYHTQLLEKLIKKNHSKNS